MPIARLFLLIAAIFGGTAVAGGAFASHALREQLSERLLTVFETGVRYQMYHALALFGVVLLLQRPETETVSTWLTAAGWAFITGILIFSGSLYVLSLTQVKMFGAITPLGGVALMAGWICLAIFAVTAPEL